VRIKSVSKLKKAVCVLTACLVLAALLFSASYIIHEADHNCAGENCAVCSCIQFCKSIIQGMNSGLLLLPAALFPLVFLTFTAALCRVSFFRRTPVSGKVRLNN
jgi:hypothetical protein